MIELRIEEYNNHKIAVSHHDAKSNDIVIFCHGYRGTSVGTGRFFVRVAQKLEEAGVSSIRFDQYGSGNSDGDFFDSSFSDWCATTKSIAQDYLDRGNRVVLFGQSMGGATVISVGSELPKVMALVAVVPDPNVESFDYPESGYIEEGGQRIQAVYWQEAHDARVANQLTTLEMPTLIIQCTDDEYVDKTNRKAIIDNARSSHKIINLKDYKHSNWSYDQTEKVIAQTVDFIVESLGK